jgi:hypothetical protein
MKSSVRTAVYVVVLPVAMIALGAWGLHAWLRPAPPAPTVDSPLIYTRGVIVHDNEGRERIVLRAKDDEAEILIDTPDGSGRVLITTGKRSVKIVTAQGTQFFEITPDGTESYNAKGPK